MGEPNYWQRLSERQLGRRALLRSGGIVAAGLGAAGLAGCNATGGGSAKTGGAPASSGVAAGPPQKGGVLTSKVPTDPPTTWPAAGAISYNVVHPFASGYNQLLQYDPQDPDNKIIPDLADSYEIAGDGKSVVFKLHPGVKFHDGSDFSSEDVRATIDWDRNPPAKKSSSQKGNLTAIDHVETPDLLTAKVVLKQPNPSLIPILASHVLSMGAKGDVGKDEFATTLLNGTGPFKLKSFTRGVSVEMERNPNYWVKDRPYLDGVKHLVAPDENTAMTNLIAGHFHRFFPVLPDNIVRVDKETGGRAKVYTPVAANRAIVFFNGSKKPYND